MLNSVTEHEGVAGAVLVRALEPTFGTDEMLLRRTGSTGRRLRPIDIANGPGKLAAALGITLADNGAELGSATLSVRDGPSPHERIAASGRVGLSEGHELELRFYLEGNPFVSKGRTGAKPARVRHERGQG
jgi:DNA-3-methyladenine glycosylase